MESPTKEAVLLDENERDPGFLLDGEQEDKGPTSAESLRAYDVASIIVYQSAVLIIPGLVSSHQSSAYKYPNNTESIPQRLVPLLIALKNAPEV